MAQLVSKRYATALFELSKENNSIDIYYDEVTLIFNAIANDKDFSTIINNPQFTTDEKLNLFHNIFDGKVSEDILGLLNIVILKNRENLLMEILQLFLGEVEKYKGIVKAYVSSAIELNQSQLDSIKIKLENNLNKKVEVITTVDQALVGGVKISVCGHIIDNTIKSQLDNLKKQLLTVSI